MAHVFVRVEGEWRVCSLDERPDASLRLGALPGAAGIAPGTDDDPRIVRVDAAKPEAWVLLAAGGGTAVNGLPLPAGLRVLRDRDEIRTRALAPIYFSTETTAEVVPLPPDCGEVICPRCCRAIDPGAPAIRCPGCGVWYCASAEFPCWSYSPTCSLCPQPTDLEAGYGWSPELV